MLRLVAIWSIVVMVACAPPSAAPPPAPGGAQTVSEWDRVLEAAKREGKVVVAGPAGADRKDALTEDFESRYGITVEYAGLPIRELLPRVHTERGSNQYLWDIYIGGTGIDLAEAVPSIFDPLEPALIRPEVKDLKQWRGEALEFFDEGRRLMVMTPFQRGIIFVNPTMVGPEEIKSYRDLLDPKWRGKIVSDDPRTAGPGQATFTYFYLHPELGPDYIRALGRHELTLMRDYSQEVDAVGQGRYPILIGTSDAIVEQRLKQGVPISIVDPRQLREGSDLSPAAGNVAIFNRAPNPNAAKVYVNWLLTKEGQTPFIQATGYVSSRLDVTTEYALPWRVPISGAVKTYTMHAMETIPALNALLEEVFGR
jgi:iron(III) transport system substrate-binding protein